MANTNSKMFFACGANKKAFGQIDQPKGTKPREIRTLGVHCKVGCCLFSRPRRPRRPRNQGDPDKKV